MSDIFISYARSTASQARAVGGALSALGYSVWRDDDLPSHRSYGDVIEEQLGAAKAVVVLWSAEAVRSQWVRSEADRARGENKLVQVAVDEARLPMPFDQIQCADLADWAAEPDHLGWIKTLASIAVLAGPPVTATAAAEATGPTLMSAGNLPRRQGALIGRAADLEQIGALVDGADLVTITGAGGVGKTRIAVEFAHSRQGRHEDGVWLVELAPLTDPDQVSGAIARALGVDLPGGRDPVEALVTRLRPRDCLIVLDNCEHVIDVVAALADAVLEHAPRVKLIASSQELLGVDGERVFRLRSLAEADSAILFIERARAADAAFQVRARDEAAILAICQRLDGIPLAIEMAAARAPALGCEGVLKRLDDRFRILTGGRRTALPRQRTLQAALDWSHGLLSREDASVFRRLGVFTAGFTLEAAAKVAGGETLDELQVIDAVSSLVAKSLVTADAGEERSRYRLLETTRMYALEQLAAADETSALQRRHAEYFVDFTETSRSHYYSLSDEAFHARYAPEMPDIERAMEWAFGPDGDDQLGVIVAARSWPCWVGLSSAQRFLPWGEVALSRLGPETPPRHALMLKRSMLSAYANMAPGRAPPFGAQILDDLRDMNDPEVLGDALNSMAQSLRLLGRTDEAKAYSAELSSLVAPLPTTRLKLASLAQAAYLVWERDIAEGVVLLRAASELALSIGADGWANIFLTDSLNELEADPEPRIAGARALLGRIRPHHMFANASISSATYILADALATRNGPGDVEEAYGRVRGLEKIVGRQVFVGWVRVLALMAVQDGRVRDGARLFGHFQAGLLQSGVDFLGSRRGTQRGYAVLGQHLSPTELETLMAQGAGLTPEQAYVLAMNLT